MNDIYLEREGSSPWGTAGTLMMGDDWECKTLELPWRANARGKSCIPAGTYRMELRDSPRVESITKGRHPRGWEVTSVHGRTHIMFHPGNWIRNSDGCILVGGRHSVIHDAAHGIDMPGVTSSQPTFDVLMERLAVAEAWDIHIIWASTEYP